MYQYIVISRPEPEQNFSATIAVLATTVIPVPLGLVSFPLKSYTSALQNQHWYEDIRFELKHLLTVGYALKSVHKHLRTNSVMIHGTLMNEL